MSATRYVILHHQTESGDHWDLMIEQEEGLATWSLAENPLEAKSWPISAKKLPDHRKHYLTYEGPISKNRGSVTRVDEGRCEVAESGEGLWRFRLSGGGLVGDFVLERGVGEVGDEGWGLGWG